MKIDGNNTEYTKSFKDAIEKDLLQPYSSVGGTVSIQSDKVA